MRATDLPENCQRSDASSIGSAIPDHLDHDRLLDAAVFAELAEAQRQRLVEDDAAQWITATHDCRSIDSRGFIGISLAMLR